MSSSVVPNEPRLRAPGIELELVWRSSRHARRLLTLGASGLFVATVARRPEFAGVAAPALLLLAAGRVQLRPPRIVVRLQPSSRRGFEGELMALDVTADGQGDCDARWRLHPGQEIEPVGATTANGPEARFTFRPERWGRRQIGALVVVFSALLDQRFVEALREMRERGLTVLVVDVLNAEPPLRRRTADRMARRIEQEAIRFSLRELGVPVVHWDGVQFPGPAAGRLHPSPPGGPPMTRAGTAAIAIAACLLGAGCVVWASAPLVHKGFANFALFLAIFGVAAARCGSPWPASRCQKIPTCCPCRCAPGLVSSRRSAGCPGRKVRSSPLVAGGAAPVPAVAHRHPGRRPHRLPARRPPGRIRRLPGSAQTAGPRAGGRRGPARARRGGRNAPGGRPGAGSALLRLVAAGALIAAGGLVLPYVARPPGT